MDYSVAEQNLVTSGARWAIGLGVFFVVIGLVALVAAGMLFEHVPAGLFVAAGTLTLAMGAVSLWLGLRLNDPSKRRPSQFRTLVWMYGAVVALGVLDLVLSLVRGEGVSGLLGILIPTWGLARFVQGLRALRSIEEDAPAAA